MLNAKNFPAQAGIHGHQTDPEEAGHKLRRARERLNLRVRDVERASLRLAERYHNDEFAVLINRISEIENRGLVPTLFKLYSLCAIYRLDFQDVLEWYGIRLSSLPADSACCEITRTHALGFQNPERGEVLVPFSLDPGIDVRATTYFSRMIQRWGKIPLLFLDGLNLQDQRYAFIGTNDWFMHPLLQPGSFVLIDEGKNKIAESGWTSEFDRPVYFLEHRQGYVCGWCSLSGDRLLALPHPASGCTPQSFRYPAEVDVIGQVIGVAMRLDQSRKRRTRS